MGWIYSETPCIRTGLLRSLKTIMLMLDKNTWNPNTVCKQMIIIIIK